VGNRENRPQLLVNIISLIGRAVKEFVWDIHRLFAFNRFGLGFSRSQEMVILKLLQMHYGSCCPVLLSRCSDALIAVCSSCLLWMIFGFALGCRGLGEAWRGGCARLLPVLGRSMRVRRRKRASKSRRPRRRYRPRTVVSTKFKAESIQATRTWRPSRLRVGFGGDCSGQGAYG
jgi:hypothetical protein